MSCGGRRRWSSAAAPTLTLRARWPTPRPAPTPRPYSATPADLGGRHRRAASWSASWPSSSRGVLVAGANERLEGGSPTFGSAFSKAALPARLAHSAGRSSTPTVGMILQAIRERAGILGAVIAGLGGAAWNIITWLTVPIDHRRGHRPDRRHQALGPPAEEHLGREPDRPDRPRRPRLPAACCPASSCSACCGWCSPVHHHRRLLFVWVAVVGVVMAALGRDLPHRPLPLRRRPAHRRRLHEEMLAGAFGPRGPRAPAQRHLQLIHGPTGPRPPPRRRTPRHRPGTLGDRAGSVSAHDRDRRAATSSRTASPSSPSTTARPTPSPTTIAAAVHDALGPGPGRGRRRRARRPPRPLLRRLRPGHHDLERRGRPRPARPRAPSSASSSTSFPKPVVIACTGHALAMGGILLFCRRHPHRRRGLVQDRPQRGRHRHAGAHASPSSSAATASPTPPSPGHQPRPRLRPRRAPSSPATSTGSCRPTRSWPPSVADATELVERPPRQGLRRHPGELPGRPQATACATTWPPTWPPSRSTCPTADAGAGHRRRPHRVGRPAQLVHPNPFSRFGRAPSAADNVSDGFDTGGRRAHARRQRRGRERPRPAQARGWHDLPLRAQGLVVLAVPGARACSRRRPRRRRGRHATRRASPSPPSPSSR